MDLPEIRSTWTHTKGVWLRKTESTLVPWGEEAVEQLLAIKIGKLGVGNIRGARNPAQLRLYWALVDVVAKANDSTKEQVDGGLRAALLPSHTFTDIFGRVHTEYPSIALTAMPQAEFNNFFKLSIEMMATAMGAAPSELRDHFNEMIDNDVRQMMREGYMRDLVENAPIWE